MTGPLALEKRNSENRKTTLKRMVLRGCPGQLQGSRTCGPALSHLTKQTPKTPKKQPHLRPSAARMALAAGKDAPEPGLAPAGEGEGMVASPPPKLPLLLVPAACSPVTCAEPPVGGPSNASDSCMGQHSMHSMELLGVLGV